MRTRTKALGAVAFAGALASGCDCAAALLGINSSPTATAVRHAEGIALILISQMHVPVSGLMRSPRLHRRRPPFAKASGDRHFTEMETRGRLDARRRARGESEPGCRSYEAVEFADASNAASATGDQWNPIAPP